MESDNKNVSSLILDALRVKGISLEKLAHATGVSERYLNLIVEEKFENLPAAPYIHGYLMKVADVLNLDGKKLWIDYLKDNEIIRRSGERDLLPRNRFAVSSPGKGFIGFVFAILLIAGFIIIRVVSFYNESGVTLYNLNDNNIVYVASLNVAGKVNPSDELTLNGELIYPDEGGNFQKLVDLRPGFNTLVFKIKGFLGKEHAVVKQVFYQTAQNIPVTQSQENNNR